jgi:hypothetical protein
MIVNKYTIKVRISRENNITKLGDRRNIPISSDDNTTVNIESNYITLCLLSIYKQG